MSAPLPRQDLVLYQSYFEKAPIGVVVIDEKGLLVWMNDLARAFLGARNLGEVILSSKDWPQFRNLLTMGEAFFFAVQEQGFIFTPQKLASEDKRQLLWMVPSNSMEMDLSTMQRDLIQQRKLANLGQMMLEMAHELNNPLTGISMGTQLIGLTMQKLRKLLLNNSENPIAIDLLEKMESELKRINESTGKASNLRQELLSHNKSTLHALEAITVRDLIEGAVNNFGCHPIFQDMKIICDFPDESASILCEPSKLEQILYNLVKNAHDATGGKGTVWIREYRQRNYASIEIEDNGPGLPEELLGKAFSPFLTTKPLTGNGLGLSISQQIIHQHGGTITVYNKPGSGACFQLTFPSIEKRTTAGNS